jgi:hypothetical protein
MLATTLQIIKSGLQGDPTLSPRERTLILAALRNGQATGKAEQGEPTKTATPSAPRLIRRAEAARRLGCSLRLVDRLAKDGILPKRLLPNRRRAAGIPEDAVTRLITGIPQSNSAAPDNLLEVA